MENLYLISYPLKACLASAIFYLCYLAILKQDTFFTIKRIYLLTAMIIPFVYPLITLQLSENVTEYNAVLQTIIVTGESVNGFLNEQKNWHNNLSMYNILIIIWLIGSIFLSLSFFMKLKMIYTLFNRRKYMKVEKINNCKVYYSEDDRLSSFSFFRSIFINNKDNISKQEILQHELLHIKYYHSIEIIFAEIMTIVFWWNPLVWFIKNEIKINQECMVDQKMIDSGFDKKQYQYALLNETIKNTSISIINNFNVSQLKKRICMMNKKRTNQIGYLKYLIMIMIPATLCIANSQSVVANNIENISTNEIEINEPLQNKKILTSCETMPQFHGGESAMFKFLAENLQYPKKAETDKTEGRVIVRFVVDENGKVVDPTILRGLSPECDAEALRVVKAMPNWTPGTEKGKVVAVYYTLPLLFRLSK